MHSILTDGDYRLTVAAKPVSRNLIRAGRYCQLIEEMRQLLESSKGIGLAAPQLGESIRLIVIEDTEARMSHLSMERRKLIDRHPVEFTALFNPRIISESIDTATYFETCLSHPGIIGAVRRPLWILVSALDAKGNEIIFEAKGWLARSILHEMDHLDGESYLDKALITSIMPIEDFLSSQDIRNATSDELELVFDQAA